MFLAGVAHLVERHLAKVEVASSSLVTRSKNSGALCIGVFFCKTPESVYTDSGVLCIFRVAIKAMQKPTQPPASLPISREGTISGSTVTA